jgi:hypothetical protein
VVALLVEQAALPIRQLPRPQAEACRGPAGKRSPNIGRQATNGLEPWSLRLELDQRHTLMIGGRGNRTMTGSLPF